MHSMNEVLPEGALVLFPPDDLVRHVVQVVLPDVEDRNGQVGQNSTQKDRQDGWRTGASTDQGEIDHRMARRVHMPAQYSEAARRDELIRWSIRSVPGPISIL